jgi:signal peptidase I
MMPTLDVCDFILVNNFAFGLRLPAFNDKFVDLGEPKRGDVVVFRFPGYLCRVGGHLVRSGDMTCNDPHAAVPQQNWIKRVVGLPGDSIEVHGADVVINGVRVNAQEVGPYVGNPARAVEQTMLDMGATVWTEHLGAVSHAVARMPEYNTPKAVPNDMVPSKVPAGCYLVMGDNRNDSLDSRWWGCMPEQNLAGKAFLIWMSWKGLHTGGVDFSRIGTIIH